MDGQLQTARVAPGREAVGIPPTQSEVNSDAREQIRDWEFLFWAFLVFGLARLAWIYLYQPENKGFHLGLSCGFVFCGVLGFLMRWVFSPKREK